MLELHQAGQLKLEELVTREYILDEVNQGYADMHAGDHLHPSDAGYAVMADSVDLSIFAGKPVGSKPKDKTKKK